MKVHYPKLYNMTHLLALNVFLLPKGLTIILFNELNIAEDRINRKRENVSEDINELMIPFKSHFAYLHIFMFVKLACNKNSNKICLIQNYQCKLSIFKTYMHLHIT